MDFMKFFASIFFVLLSSSISLADSTDIGLTPVKKTLYPDLHYKPENAFSIQSKKFPDALFTFYLGGSLLFFEGNNQLGNSKMEGTKYNFNKDLDYPEVRLAPRINAFIKINEISRVLLTLYNVRNRSVHTLEKDIWFRDTLFTKGTDISSRFRMSTVSVAYNYSFLQRDRGEVGILLGGSTVYFLNEIETENLPENYTQRNGTWAFLPFAGFNCGIYLAENLYLRGIVNYFSLHLHDYDFTVFNFKPSLEYFPFNNFGFGTRYHYAYNMISDLPWNDYNGKIKVKFNAISLFACYRIVKKRDNKNE